MAASENPSYKPSMEESDKPSSSPTERRTFSPTLSPSSSPSNAPSITSRPTEFLPPPSVSEVPYTLHEAEDHTLSADSSIIYTNLGYTGSGWVKMVGKDSFVEFTNVDFGGGGSCQLKFRFALKRRSAKQKPAKISISGVEAGYLNFRATGPNGGYYGYDQVVTACPSGVHNVRLTAITDDGGPNLDHLAVSPIGVPLLDVPATRYEAEDATNSLESSIVSTSYPGHTGSGSVIMQSELYSSIEFTNVNFGSGGSCKIDFRYSMQKSSDSTRPCRVTINDIEYGVVNFSETGPTYNDYANEMMLIDCPPGVATVRITATSSSAQANIDNMVIAPVGASPLNIPISHMYEAESASNTMSSDSTTATQYLGYSGSGYVMVTNQDSWVEFKGVDFGSGGSCKMDFRYMVGQGTRAPRPCKVSINGEDIGVLRFYATGSTWGTYGVDMMVFECPAGVGDVRVTATSTYKGPFVDNLVLSSVGGIGGSSSPSKRGSEETY